MTYNFKLRPVAGACALLMLGLAGAACAQDATPANAPPASAASAEKEMATVTVSGIRRGIEAAISLKRNSSSIIEAISAEDIGKLPDNSVAESVSRLPGVATQRNLANGNATGVSVRGLSPAFNGSLLNGREQASTSDARSPEFDLFPSELTGSVLIYKTPDASLIGQGLASTIDLRTLRPLEFGKRVLQASYRKERKGFGAGAEIGEGDRKTLTYVDQFFDRKVGLSIGLTSMKQDNGGELIFNNWGSSLQDVQVNGQTVKAIGGFTAEVARRNNERDGAALTLQFKPNAAFRTTADAFYSRGSEATKRTGLEGAIATNAGIYDPNAVVSNATVVNGIVTDGTFSNYKGVVRNHLIGNTDKLLSLGLTNELKLDAWRLTNDLSHSKGTRNIRNYETTAGQPGNTPASALGSISYSGFNGTNFSDVKYTPSLNYADRGITRLTDVNGWGGGPLLPQAGYVSLPEINDKVVSVRLSGERDLQWGPMAKLKLGVNYTKRDKSRLGEEGRLYVLGADGYASADLPGTGTGVAGITGIPVAAFDPSGTLGSIYGLSRWVDNTVLGREWQVQEKVGTAYAMADLDGQLFSLPYTGNVGVQVVHTKQSSSGNQVDQAACTGNTIDTCPYSVRSGGTSYANVLPSLNLTFDLGQDQVVRVGAAKLISRGNLDNMRSSFSFGLPPGTAVDPALSGYSGNPELKPYAARSLDVSYEKYFGKKGYISVAGFYKKLDNYVINAPQTFDFTPFLTPSTPLPATGQFAGSPIGFLTKPVNGTGGNMQGLELAVNIPFSLFSRVLDGFGISASHSYTDSSVTLPTSGFVTPNNSPVFNNQVADIGLPGLSKNVSSVRLYYENHGLQVALAAYKRSSFIGQILDYRSDSQFTFIKGETIADAQVSYEIGSGWLKGVSLFLQGHNLTNEPFRQYTSDPNVYTNTVTYGRTYSAGANVKF